MESVAAPANIEPLKAFTSENAWPAVPRLLASALWMVAAVIVTGWLILAALHVRDDYRMTHTHGVWIAAAESAREGRLYPPLFDGEHYAGTRYMPVPILLNAAASALAGDPVTGGKALAAALMGTLLVLVVFVLRRVSCPWPIAVGLSATIVATDAGLDAGTTIGGDLVPAALQLGAVAVALRGGRRAIAVAGVLAGIAVASKLTGMWGSLAIVTWLVAQRRWPAAATFAAASLLTAAVLLGAVQLFTGGGLFEHLQAFSAAGVQSAQSLMRAPNKLLYQLTAHAFGTVVVFPLAVLGAILAAGWRQQSVLHIALGYALVLLLVVYTDVGTGSNQLLDVVLLAALAVGVLAGRAARSPDAIAGRVLVSAIALTVIWGAGIDMVRTIGGDLRHSIAAVKAGQSAAPVGKVVAGMVRPGERVLTADPSIDVALGRQPLVMDPFMLVRLDRTHPEWIDPLIARIERRQFDVVVMVVRLENPEVDFWWSDYQFGPRVARALRESYRFEGMAGRYHLYRPRE